MGLDKDPELKELQWNNELTWMNTVIIIIIVIITVDIIIIIMTNNIADMT